MVVFWLILSVLAYVIVVLGMGRLGKNVFKNTKDQLFFQFIRNLMAVAMMVVIVLVTKSSFLPHGFTLLLAGCMGLATLLSSVSSIECYRHGPVGISVLIFSSMAMLISTLSGPIFWHESISVFQIIGIVLSLASMVLLTEKSLVKKASFKWIIFLILAGIGGGAQGPIQKVLATSAYAGENIEFITYTFVFCSVASLIAFFLLGNREKEEKVTYRIKGTVLALFLSQAVLSVFLNINNLQLVKELPTVIFFPVYSIGGLLLTTVASRFLFKEKMSLRQIFGFAAGVIALLMISGTLDGIIG